MQNQPIATGRGSLVINLTAAAAEQTVHDDGMQPKPGVVGEENFTDGSPPLQQQISGDEKQDSSHPLIPETPDESIEKVSNKSDSSATNGATPSFCQATVIDINGKAVMMIYSFCIYMLT